MSVNACFRQSGRTRNNCWCCFVARAAEDQNIRESGEHLSEKGSSRGSCFLGGLSMKMALVIEKPNEKSKAKHRQNKPNFYRVEIS
jgi:hypothetical protein